MKRYGGNRGVVRVGVEGRIKMTEERYGEEGKHRMWISVGEGGKTGR